MANDDYYQILNVARTASDEEIKKSYRKLARENHPDRRPDDKAAAERFKKIQSAYDVLGDAEKRKKYDMYGSAYDKMGGAGGYSGGGYSGGGSGPIDLEQFFGGAGGGGGFDINDLFGGGGQRRSPRRPQKGRDVQSQITIPFHLAATGGNYELTPSRGTTSERLNVKIPPGIANNATIRLAGQGEPSMSGGPTGDLLVTVRVAPHPYFKRDGANLVLEVPITLAEATLGAKIDVPTLNEGEVTVTIPAGTSSGAKLRLKGKGVLDTKTKQPGDQMIQLKVTVPKHVPEQAANLLREFDQIVDQHPRERLWN